MLLIEQQSPCPECGSKTEVDYAHGEAVCAECGLVVQDPLIDGSPGSVPDEEFIARESYIAPSRHVRGSKDANGRPVNRLAVMRLDRAQFWRAREVSEQDREEMAARILQITSALGLPKAVAERAIWLYLHLEREGHKRRQVVALALVLTVARERRIPLMLTALAKFLPAGMTRGRKAVVDMHYAIARKMAVENGHLTLQESIQGFVNAVDGDFELLARSKQIAAGTPCPEKLAERLFAAACVFAALKERDRWLSESGFSKKIGLSEISLRKGFTLAGLTTGRREIVPAIDLSSVA